MGGEQGQRENEEKQARCVGNEFVIILPEGTYTREDYDHQFGRWRRATHPAAALANDGEAWALDMGQVHAGWEPVSGGR